VPTILRPNDKAKVVAHYNLVSPYYLALWGEHLHHGYWVTGDESIHTAQVQLIEHLAERAQIKSGSEVLDIGCGMGASSLYLTKHFHSSAIGITISSVQLEMANKAAAETGLDAAFLLMDAEAMVFDRQFDLLWSIESISHYHDRRKFFTSAAKLLKPGGTFAIIDWFKKEGLSSAQIGKFIDPIERGMFVELQTMDEYASYFTSNGLRVVHRENLNGNCVKTWDITLDIILRKPFWNLALCHALEFIHYLKAFQAMRAGFATGNFVYGLLVAKAPPFESAV
jgi:tocopherol O-methyltransferase